MDTHTTDKEPSAQKKRLGNDEWLLILMLVFGSIPVLIVVWHGERWTAEPSIGLMLVLFSLLELALQPVRRMLRAYRRYRQIKD